ncbi:MAG TPA: DUF5615 family PIN-like protein [Burkholderiales bacterium]
MKLLFYENLPPVLVESLAELFTGSEHVHRVGLGSADDEASWKFARARSFTIVTKDSDFHERGLLVGYPPKVIWIRRGNCSTADIEMVLRSCADDIRQLGQDDDAAVLILL